MKQLTAKTVEDVLNWIETKPHHYAASDEEPGFFILKGRDHKLRIPDAIHAQTSGLVQPGDEFDRRMYRATEAGLARLRPAPICLHPNVVPMSEGLHCPDCGHHQPA